MAESYKDAESDYMSGMKYKDIAAKYGVTLNTVKSWKQRYAWDKKGVHTKKENEEKVCTQKKDASAKKKTLDDGTRETFENKELTPEQQLFCIYYIRSFNATQSYLNAYKCSYNVANCEGYKMLLRPAVKAEIDRLKDIKRQHIVASEEDIVELQMRIAFSDIGNYAGFNKNYVTLKQSSETDTQLIKKIKEGPTGVSIEIEDRQKAINWLTKHFLMHPEDKYRAEFDRKRAEVGDNTADEILQNMKTISDIISNPSRNREIGDFE